MGHERDGSRAGDVDNQGGELDNQSGNRRSPDGGAPPNYPGKRTRTERLGPSIDRLADRIATVLQRRAESGAVAAPSATTAAGSSGAALPAAVRAKMEDAFAFDFGAVRVHEGSEAPAVGALAFAQGNALYFAPGQYAPDTARGQELLGHELAHVVQQAEGRVAATTQRKGVDINDDASLEHEADVWGRRAAQGESVGRGAGPTQNLDAARSPAQRQPDAGVNPPATPAPAGRATLNFLPVLMDQAPAGWGVTTEDDAVFDITAHSDGTAWKCVITTANQQAHQGVRLVAGVVEVTNAMVAAEASAAKLTTMATSLKTVADQGAHSGFYMISAVQAHENLHITQYRTAIASHYTTLKAAIEALTAPFAGNADAAAAKTAIKALPAFTTAMATFHAADVAANNATAAHAPMAPFITAEHTVVDPMIATINARKAALAPPPPPPP